MIIPLSAKMIFTNGMESSVCIVFQTHPVMYGHIGLVRWSGILRNVNPQAASRHDIPESRLHCNKTIYGYQEPDMHTKHIPTFISETDTDHKEGVTQDVGSGPISAFWHSN